jgi:hypothetical protein
VQQAVQALLDDMIVDPEIGTWNWQQALYGKPTRYLGAGHGFAGNVYPALRATALLNADTVRTFEQRALDTLSATTLHRMLDAPGGPVELINWHVVTDADRLAAWIAKGGRPLVQDCHGAPGIVCRLAGAPRTPEWDRMLLGAGELIWHAGPLAKGPSLCHGTAGNAMACLKLWRRFSDTRWLDRARQLALPTASGRVISAWPACCGTASAATTGSPPWTIASAVAQTAAMPSGTARPWHGPVRQRS